MVGREPPMGPDRVGTVVFRRFWIEVGATTQ